jgi:hypothetical protein
METTMSWTRTSIRSGLGPIAALSLFLFPLLSAGVAPDPGAAAPNRYIGAAQCKNCHSDAASGDQYGAWTKEKHSEAYQVLAGDKAKQYAKDRGIEDPQKSEQCLKCHVTAFSEPKENLHRSFDPKLGVQCETCHGPGESHKRARMAAAAEASGDAKPGYTKIPDDEIVKAPTSETCVKCHNTDSPGYKPFCFHVFVAEIRHLDPRKPRTDEEKKALEACDCAADCVCKKDSKDGKCAMPPGTPIPDKAGSGGAGADGGKK